MSRLVRTSEITKLPVVTLAGEDVAQVKDIVYSSDGGAVGGFTLAGRGLLAGPLKQGVAWTNLLGVGADAVMITDEEALDPVGAVVEAASGDTGGSGGKVLGSRVLTESGVDLGSVVDVVLQFDEGTGSGPGPCDVVGYEIEASETLAAKSSKGAKGTKLLIPLPDTVAVSGEHLMVPSGAEGFVTQDLAGFGAAVAAFRAQLEEGRS
ncbi:MAG: PRC-barrel domain protein [Nocardioidaceae bacterium]|nr:PRC-barrel domain protein [Nocardioidaceae bacterium]